MKHDLLIKNGESLEEETEDAATEDDNYFLRLRILKDHKEIETHYFVPAEVAKSKNVSGYVVTFTLKNDRYSFNLIKDKHVIGEWDNIIEPGQKTKFTYEENELEFTLVGVQSHKKIVRKYLKDNKASVWEFDNFCLFIKEPVKEKKRNTGPLNPTSGMDPDIRAEYAKGEGGDKKQ